jgi:hypothetical protein
MNGNSVYKVLQTLLSNKTVDHKRNIDVKDNLNIWVITGETDDYDMRCL